MLDVLQILFWVITYILIIVYSLKNKKILIPITAVALNFSWEINALIASRGFWGHVIWLFLDIVILYLCIIKLESVAKKMLLFSTIIVLVLIFYCVFKFEQGMLNSSFIIDFIMALCFWLERKKLGQEGQCYIATTKLIGSSCAWLFYFQDSLIVKVAGAMVFVFNIAYLCYFIELKKISNKNVCEK